MREGGWFGGRKRDWDGLREVGFGEERDWDGGREVGLGEEREIGMEGGRLVWGKKERLGWFEGDWFGGGKRLGWREGGWFGGRKRDWDLSLIHI